MRTKSRAQVAADRAKGMRARKGATVVYSGPLTVRAAIQRSPAFASYISSPGPKIGDDMRRKFALRGQRDLELSKAYTQAEVEAIMSKYGPL